MTGKVLQRSPGDGYLTREELAHRLGVSTAEIRRREALGQIAYTMRGPHNICLYPEDLAIELTSIVGVNSRNVTTQPKSYRGTYNFTAAEAKKVFVLLGEGMALDKIVVNLEMHPGVVQSIMHEYVIMTGSMMVKGPVMKQINELPLDGNFPLATAEDLLSVLMACASSDCIHCHKRPKAVCKHCIQTIAEKMEV